MTIVTHCETPVSVSELRIAYHPLYRFMYVSVILVNRLVGVTRCLLKATHCHFSRRFTDERHDLSQIVNVIQRRKLVTIAGVSERNEE